MNIYIVVERIQNDEYYYLEDAILILTTKLGDARDYLNNILNNNYNNYKNIEGSFEIYEIKLDEEIKYDKFIEGYKFDYNWRKEKFILEKLDCRYELR